MATSYGWKPSRKDVDEFRHNYVRAETILEDAAESMTSMGNAELIDAILPVLPDVDDFTTDTLGVMFASRDDFNRNLRYLKAIQRESKKKEYQNTAQLGYYGNLTAARYDENGMITEGAFVGHQKKLQDVAEKRRTKKRLEKLGVETKDEVLTYLDPETGAFETVYDENRHPIKVTVPATPQARELYKELINKDASLSLDNFIPEDDMYVDMYGDMVEVKKATRHVASPESVAKGLFVDTTSDYRTLNYFENYADIMQTVVPGQYSDEIRYYVDAIEQMSPAERARVYDVIEHSTEDAGSLEYLYRSIGESLNRKLHSIIHYWRNEVKPLLHVDDYERAAESVTLQSITRTLENEGISTTDSTFVMDEYQRRKKEGKNLNTTFDDISLILRMRNED